MQTSYLILGLARSGLATLRWLLDQGSKVFVSDANPESVALASSEGGIPWTEGQKFSQLTALIQSPGIPLDHPLTQAARAQGIKIMGDVDLFRQNYPTAKIIGVTGTNGKSTTTTLIGHILKNCNVPIAVGGNVGIPVMSLPKLPDNGVYVIELSSYQLELSTCLGLTIVAWTNITPDHLERHKTMRDYVYAKSQIFASPTVPPQSIICVDDSYSKDLYNRMNAAHPGYFTPVSVVNPLRRGVFVYDGMLIDALAEERINLGEITQLKYLKGPHNYQNIAIAYGVSRKLGLNSDEIMAAIQTFPGLAHRQEYVETRNGVIFINDSKATNAEAASHALKAYENIYWILGGVAKSDGIDELLPLLERVKKAYLIGEASNRFAQTLAGKIPYRLCLELEKAVREAYTDAAAEGNGVVLLSPACASFDQFKDFECRGNAFKEIVNKLLESPQP
ncbi:UDP-N-acetylmuramoyl-L-alanine--D-glutamate ligase [Candidatus Odyssella thessalonicensis]|uniref:UDP-N-acetylmuramoyl-L-alanine--D-glutamate ligase n=1 Tax=Candidatus Odyssella thessalonicensis TaxID=84647 RepID=UPI000225B911|nr:UDP-N-acetylmuramoyl-L-alanine--D-glutamate ligase [Candidatus Odyssella thessalonicensis]